MLKKHDLEHTDLATIATRDTQHDPAPRPKREPSALEAWAHDVLDAGNLSTDQLIELHRRGRDILSRLEA